MPSACTWRGWKQDGGRIELSRDVLYNLWRIILDSCPDPSSGKMFCMKKEREYITSSLPVISVS